MLSISATPQLPSIFCAVQETKPNVWYSELANAESDKDQTEIPVSLLELFNNRRVCDPCRPGLAWRRHQGVPIIGPYTQPYEHYDLTG